MNTVGFALIISGYVLGMPGAAWLSFHNHEHGAVILWRWSVVLVLAGCGIALA